MAEGGQILRKCVALNEELPQSRVKYTNFSSVRFMSQKNYLYKRNFTTFYYPYPSRSKTVVKFWIKVSLWAIKHTRRRRRVVDLNRRPSGNTLWYDEVIPETTKGTTPLKSRYESKRGG